MKQKLICGDEYDVVVSRQVHNLHPGETKKVKRRLNKRIRKEGKHESKEDTQFSGECD